MHNTTDPTICPPHLTVALGRAGKRWTSTTNQCRAWQAAEVFGNASVLAEGRSWDSEEAMHEAELGLWLLQLAHHEDVAGRTPLADATPDAAELAAFRAWKASQK